MSTDAPPRVHNPFVGPTSFRLGDPLYGRDRERGDLLDLLVAERIVLFYSPSGAGKTSLIQAALVPALQEAGFEVLPVIRVTHALEPRPGMPTPRNRYVLGTLLSLEEGVPPARQRPVAELATLTLREYMDAHADRDGQPGNEVLLFDQFEEVLTADPTDEPAKHAFFRELGAMLRDRDHWALFSMREDFLAALDPYLRHVPTRFRSTYRLDLLSVPAALDAMRLPARRAGVDFTEEAADQLVDDLRRVRVQQPGGGTEEALGSYVEPVQLQVACRLLWSTLPPTSASITRADVEALGDVDQALAEYYADRVGVIARDTGAREAAIREWFEECLITPQGLRGQVLEGPEPSGPAGGAVLDRLVGAHLVRAERRRQATWYELAHDRLIEPVRRDNAAWRASHLTSFERAAALWAEQGRPDRLLLLGPDLAAAEGDPAVRQGELKVRERDFLEASRRADEQQRRDARTAVVLRRSARRLWIAVALVTMLAVTALSFLVESRITERQAQEQEVLYRLLNGAQRAFAWDQELAISLAAAAAERAGSDDLDPQTRAVLYQAAAASPVSMVLRGQGPAPLASLSRDGTAVVTAGTEGLQLWDRATGEARERLPLPDASNVVAVDISSTTGTVVAGFSDGDILVWDVVSGGLERWAGGTDYIWNVLVSPDGMRVVSISYDQRVQMWDLAGTKLFEVVDEGSTSAYDAAFSPDSRTLATVSDAPSAVLWDTRTGRETGRVPLPDGGAWRVTLGSDGRTLGTIAPDQTVTVWDVASGRAQHGPYPAENAVYRALDGDLARILTFEAGGQLTVQDAATGQEVAQATAPGAAPVKAIFDVMDPDAVLVLSQESDPAFWQMRPTGVNAAGAHASFTLVVTADRAFTVADDGTLSAWDADDGHHAVSGADGSSVSALAADPTGRRVAGITDDGRVHVWDAESGSELLALGPDHSTMVDLAFTTDGAEIITGDWDGRLVRWDAGTGAELGVVLDDDRSLAQVRVSPDGSRVLATLDPFSADASSSGGLQPVAVVLPLPGPGQPVELELDTGAPAGRAGLTPETVNDAAFTRNGQEVVLGTSRGRVASFDTRTGDLSWSETVHSGAVRYVVIGPAREVLTTGTDRQAVLSDPGSGRRTREVPADSDLVAATFMPSDQHIALFRSSGDRGTVPLGDEDLMDLVGSKVTQDLTPDECEFYRLGPDC